MMLAHLQYLEENMLAALQAEDDVWESVFVDYHAPFVERLWTSVTIQGVSYRVFLHRILACPEAKPLYHPHPWPSAVRVLAGGYRMQVGHGAGMDEPPVSMTLSLSPGSTYEMTHPDAWHAVQPETAPSFSLMLTGKPWSRESPKSTKVLAPLSPDARAELLAYFRRAYGVPRPPR